jgi:hypothetical protein
MATCACASRPVILKTSVAHNTVNRQAGISPGDQSGGQALVRLPNVKYRIENIAVHEIVAHLLEELERLTRN